MSAFAGKTALITGAAGGIGQVVAELFAERGARIAALDKNESVYSVVEALSGAGHTAMGVLADIGSAEEVADALDKVHQQFKTVDILVNNAGFSGASTLESTDLEIWHDDINGNLNGAYHCTRLVLGDMKRANAGAIVNIGSVNGLSTYGDPAYSAAKAGLISYTKALATEYGRYGIRANIICPGTVRTPIWDHRIARNPEIFIELLKWYPLRRVADPIDIARTAAFLASDEAAAITGAVITVDCGLSAGNIQMAREVTMERF